MYRTTSVIHAIRHESKERENIKQVLKVLLKYANPSMQDSEGKDPFMYVAIRNHNNTFHFMLDTINEHKTIIKKDNVDHLGRSLIHYIVCPLSFGSYENYHMLKKAIEVGFAANIPDSFNMTPYQYAFG